jgi:hypothetical protein
MKSLLKSALTILLIVASSEIHSQIKPGYIFGVNLSTLTMKTDGITTSPDRPAGVHFGCYLDIPIRGNFTFQPAVLFSAKGADYAIDSVEYSMSPTYMEIPVIAVYTFGSKEVRVSVFAGPYFACAIGGYKIVSGSPLKELNFGKGEDKDFRLFDYGFNFGAGVNIRGLLISAQYGLGMANISPVTTDDSEIINNVIGISISSLFERK